MRNKSKAIINKAKINDILKSCWTSIRFKYFKQTKTSQ